MIKESSGIQRAETKLPVENSARNSTGNLLGRAQTTLHPKENDYNSNTFDKRTQSVAASELGHRINSSRTA